MKAFNQAALLIALLAGVGAVVRKDPMPSVVRIAAPSKDETPSSTAPCPPGTLPDNAVCIPVPKQGQSGPEKPAARINPPARDSLPSLLQEGILRWPERPAAYDAYRLPVEGSQLSVKGLDEQDNTSFAIVISGPLGSSVRNLALEGQTGKAKVIFTDAAAGKLITLHEVDQSGHSYRYLLLYNLLDKLDPQLAPPQLLEADTVIGALRGVALQFAAFRLRPEESSALDSIEPSRLITPAFSVPCDLRNILPLK